MNTLELLQHIDLKPDQLCGMGFDKHNPTEFTLNVHKDNGAERYHLYGDKDNFVVSLGPNGRGDYTFLSACPTSEALPHLINFMSKAEGFSHEVEALQDFKANLENGKLSSLGTPEEYYSEEVKEFLDGAATKTLNEDEIKDVINKFRTKSGYEPNFEFNKEDIVGKIGEMRCSAFGNSKEKGNSLDI